MRTRRLHAIRAGLHYLAKSAPQQAIRLSRDGNFNRFSRDSVGDENCPAFPRRDQRLRPFRPRASVRSSDSSSSLNSTR